MWCISDAIPLSPKISNEYLQTVGQVMVQETYNGYHEVVMSVSLLVMRDGNYNVKTIYKVSTYL